MSSLSLSGTLVPSLRHLNAWLPVHKPAGFCCTKLAETIKLDIYFYYERFANLRPGQVFVNVFQSIEHFADGLVTFRIGSLRKERVSFKMCESIYEATIELGAEREFHSLDGKLLSRSPAGHVTLDMIEKATDEYVGFTEQKRCPFYHVNIQGLSGRTPGSMIPDHLGAKEYYNLISLPHLTKSPEKVSWRSSQKYPYFYPTRTVRIDRIEILDYQNPYLCLRIHTTNSFIVRQFANDLAEKLGTKASVVKLTRTKEGPLTLADQRVVQLHELSVDCYLSRMLSLKSLYKDFLYQMEPVVEETLH